MIKDTYRQQVLFYIWSNYQTSDKPITIKSIALGTEIPTWVVKKILDNDKFFKQKIKSHNNSLTYSKLKTFK